MTQGSAAARLNVTPTPGATPVLKIVLAIAGAIAGLVAIALIAGGTALIVVHTTQRDDDGFLTSPLYDMQTGGYALVSEDVDLASRPGDWWPADPATVRFTVDPVGTKAVFMGIGRASEVDAYLSGVSYDTVRSLGPRRDDVRYRPNAGGAPISAPADQDFWVAASQGKGLQELEWDLEKGEWTLVLMNADGSSGLRADVEAGVQIGILLPIGIGLVIAGAVGVLLVIVYLALVMQIGRKKTV